MPPAPFLGRVGGALLLACLPALASGARLAGCAGGHEGEQGADGDQALPVGFVAAIRRGGRLLAFELHAAHGFGVRGVGGLFGRCFGRLTARNKAQYCFIKSCCRLST